MAKMPEPLSRCAWANGPADYERYHDEEWGRPVGGDTALFERLCLEGFQAGLSWLTVLRKREAFRQALAGFDPESLARQGEADVLRHLADAGLIRHRGKLEAAISNARALCASWESAGQGWLTRLFEEHAPTEASLISQGYRRPPEVASDLPVSTLESKALSKALRGAGFRFVGPTTVYAALQATGFVADHLAGCFLAPDPRPQ